MSDTDLEIISSQKVFGGFAERYRHASRTTHCNMTFGLYRPPREKIHTKTPVLYWLSGLTCTDENFAQKANAFKTAAELGLVIVMPDTSPRGEGIPDDPEENYDFGLGAGFYVNATQDPWQKHYHMYDYVVEELPELIQNQLEFTGPEHISGHSMGGHGALMIALRNPGRFQKVSAFAPIVNPVQVPWGQKAFKGYLGDDKELWRTYDSCELVKSLTGSAPPIRITQGDADQFLNTQLQPEQFSEAADAAGLDYRLDIVEGYDHSYFFIASFIEEHLRWHLA